jgi:hypothetical protein
VDGLKSLFSMVPDSKHEEFVHEDAHMVNGVHTKM